jgi:hypothetical protein
MPFPEPPVPFAIPYPSERMSWALDVIGWPARELAQRIHTHEASVRQMLRGRREIPDVLGIWVETLAQMMIALPEPYGWRPKREDDL